MLEDQKGLQQLTIGNPTSKEAIPPLRRPPLRGQPLKIPPVRRGQPLSIPSPQRATSENSTYEKSTPPVKTPIFKKSAPQLRSQPHQKWPIPPRRRKRDSKRSQLWDQASGQQWSTSSRRRRGRPCAPIIGDLLNPEKSFPFQETLVKLPSTHRLWPVWSFSHEIYASP